MDAPLDFLSYVRKRLSRRRSVEPVSEVDADPGRYDRPLWHPTSDLRLIEGTQARRAVRAGDRIWLMQMIDIGGVALPPALDGMVEVADVVPMRLVPADLRAQSRESTKSHALIASEQSFWCPWVSAADVFARLEFQTRAGPGTPLPLGSADGWRGWGRLLQAPRWMSARDGRRLQRLARCAAGRPRAFISFAWRDGAAHAGEMAKILSAHGFSVWLDQFNMPRRIGTGSILAPESAMRSHLERCVADSAVFVQLETKGARCDSHWCAVERRAANKAESGPDGSLLRRAVPLVSLTEGAAPDRGALYRMEAVAAELAQAVATMRGENG